MTKNLNIKRVTITIKSYGKSIGQFTIECPANVDFVITDSWLVSKSKADKLLECLDRLSVQEQNVLKELVDSKKVTSKEIAAKLNLGISTVATYRSRIIKKLEIKSTIELLQYKDILMNKL